MSKNKNIFIVSGDPSGDIHSANLMRELLNLDDSIKFVGIGGPKMQSLGLNSIVNFESINVVGFWEVAKKYKFFKDLENKCKKLIESEKIDLVLLIDYPGLNIRLAKYAKSKNKKVCFYIAPQLWAWGKNRAEKLKNSIDKLLVVFPFEVEFFKNFGINTEFVGHPLLDLEAFDLSNSDELKKEQICLVPGSRKQEVEEHLRLFADIVEYSEGKYTFALAKSNSLPDNVYSEFLKKFPNVKVYQNSRKAMQESKFGIVKAGTSTLEASLLMLPFITIYKTSNISYYIAKYLINIGFLSIPNILLKRSVVKEFIQKDATADAILNEIDLNMKSTDLIDKMKLDFRDIRKSLGELSASKSAAKIINEEFLK